MSKVKNIIWLSDFSIAKDGTGQTGYSNISTLYCQELSKEHNIIALGLAYERNQHNYNFSLSPVVPQSLGSALLSINNGMPIDHFIVCLDIPLQRQILKLNREKMKYTGIFAVESSPLYAPWAMDLATMDNSFAISEFGMKEANKTGVNTRHLTIPVDRKIWFPRTEQEKNNIKETLGLKDKIVLFCNAAGNERKNLSIIYEAMKILKDKGDTRYHLIMLTNVGSPISWDLRELGNRFDLNKQISLLNKGLSQSEIRGFYAGADFYLNPSKAEGMCYPILEAMSVGVPVMATNATSMADHIADDRGIELDVGYQAIDPFGNTDRFYVFPDELANKLKEYSNAMEYNSELFETMTKEASDYIDQRNATNSIDMLKEIIEHE